MKFSIAITGGVKSNVHLVSPYLENKSLLLELLVPQFNSGINDLHMWLNNLLECLVRCQHFQVLVIKALQQFIMALGLLNITVPNQAASLLVSQFRFAAKDGTFRRLYFTQIINYDARGRRSVTSSFHCEFSSRTWWSASSRWPLTSRPMSLLKMPTLSHNYLLQDGSPDDTFS